MTLTPFIFFRWSNPNFSGQCLFSGLGFMLSFKHPIDECEVEVDFKYASMSFRIVKKIIVKELDLLNLSDIVLE